MQSYDKITAANADAVFSYAVKISRCLDEDEWPSDEELKREYPFSTSFDKKMRKLLKRADSNRMVRFTPIIVFKRVVVCIAMLSVMTTCVFATVPSVREAVVTTVIEWYDKYIRVAFSSDRITDIKLSESVSVDYLPEGYSLLSSEIQDAYFYSTYKNEHGNLITITIISGADTFQDVDNENREQSFVSFGSITNAIFSKGDNNNNVLSYSDCGLQVVIFSNEPLEEFIKIAENINY